jgi:hypothetical protein
VLFDPSDATRSISAGVAIDYYLKQAAEKVSIEILDADNHVIATFTGSPQDPAGSGRGRGESQPEAAEGEAGEGGGGRGRGGAVARVPVAAGMSRFTWDMRYPNARDFPGMILWSGSVRGPIAPPGRYSVRLSANNVTKTQQFAIVRNAAVATVTDADLVAQFKLAKQISDKASQANAAVIRIRNLKEQVTERAGRTSDASLKAAATTLTEKLTSVEGEIYQYRNRSNQDPLNYPIRLNNKLAALQGIVESGDARPTDQSYAVFKELSERLDKELARLDALVNSDLAAFNTSLAAQNLDTVRDAK